jgi:hypothetical protein
MSAKKYMGAKSANLTEAEQLESLEITWRMLIYTVTKAERSRWLEHLMEEHDEPTRDQRYPAGSVDDREMMALVQAVVVLTSNGNPTGRS